MRFYDEAKKIVGHLPGGEILKRALMESAAAKDMDETTPFLYFSIDQWWNLILAKVADDDT